MLMTAEMSAAQQLVIWSARAWISSNRLQRPVVDELETAYAFAGIAAAARDVDDLFHAMAHGARGCLGFGAPHCPRVHPGEAALINCLAAFQTGRTDRATLMLRGMLHPAAVRVASPPARRWALALAASGWSLETINADRFLGRRDAGLEHPLTIAFDDEPGGTACGIETGPGTESHTLH